MTFEATHTYELVRVYRGKRTRMDEYIRPFSKAWKHTIYFPRMRAKPRVFWITQEDYLFRKLKGTIQS